MINRYLFFVTHMPYITSSSSYVYRSPFYVCFLMHNTTNLRYNVKKSCKHGVTCDTSNQIRYFSCQYPKYIAWLCHPYYSYNPILRDLFFSTSNSPVMIVCFPFLIEILIFLYYHNIKTFNRIHCIFVALYHEMVCFMIYIYIYI